MELFFKPNCLEVGCDEAGRGCLAGPVVAAAVILPANMDLIKIDKKDFVDFLEQLNDSKQLTENKREQLRPLIIKYSIAYGIAEVSAEEIDKVNILNASILAMHRAIDICVKKIRENKETDSTPIESIIVDGNRFKHYSFTEQEKSCDSILNAKLSNSSTSQNITETCIVKGDSKYASIAAASILAKTYRDNKMTELDKKYPMYRWKENKAYPTKEHREAIDKFGISPYHRKSYKLLKDPVLF